MATAAREERHGRQETRQESLATTDEKHCFVRFGRYAPSAQAFGRVEWVFVMRFPSPPRRAGLRYVGLAGLTPRIPTPPTEGGMGHPFQDSFGIESAGRATRGICGPSAHVRPKEGRTWGTVRGVRYLGHQPDKYGPRDMWATGRTGFVGSPTMKIGFQPSPIWRQRRRYRRAAC